MVQKKDDGVPANSASEERLSGGKKEETKTTSATTTDAAQPYTQPVVAGGDTSAPSGGAPAAAGAGAAGGKGGSAKEPKGGKEPKTTAAGGKDKVSKAECTRALDRFLDLMIASDSRFEGIPPEVVAQMKQQGFAQASGPNPCDSQGITRSQYDCAMSATNTSAWQRCMPK